MPTASTSTRQIPSAEQIVKAQHRAIRRSLSTGVELQNVRVAPADAPAFAPASAPAAALEADASQPQATQHRYCRLPRPRPPPMILGPLTGLHVGLTLLCLLLLVNLPSDLIQAALCAILLPLTGLVVGLATGVVLAIRRRRRRSGLLAGSRSGQKKARRRAYTQWGGIALFAYAPLVLLLTVPSPMQQRLLTIRTAVSEWERILLAPAAVVPDGYCEAFGAARINADAYTASTQEVRRSRRLSLASTAAVGFKTPLTRSPVASSRRLSLDELAAMSDWARVERSAGGQSADPSSGDGGRAAPRQGDGSAWWRAWGATAAAAARALVANMSVEEASRLVAGVGWKSFSSVPGYYVGSVLGVPRLGVPSIHMHDAGQGFRTLTPKMVGQVTSWPSLLSLGATWDVRLAYAYGGAVAAEFAAKGANMLLGPSLNVHRVARGGRNAEYLSGEDAQLGAPLAAAYVRGAADAGVATVAKHFALNQQEYHRSTSSSVASERALWEVYYVPFEAAIAAGAPSVMCAYNRVNGSHACGNSLLLTRDLRERMGFEGWVMSDWWGVHDTKAAEGGVDQDMPGNDGYFDTHKLLQLRRGEAQLRLMSARVLQGMLASGAFDAPNACYVGCDCAPLMYEAVSRTESHVALARDVATAAVVLLKNDDSALPFRRASDNGSEASGTGTEANSPSFPPTSPPPTFATSLPTARGTLTPARPLALLGSACVAPGLDPNEPDWTAADYYALGGSGRVIAGDPTAAFDTGTSGPYPPLSIAAALHRRGVPLRVVDTDDAVAAASAMLDAAGALACAGATATESRDRPSLSLDQDAFLKALAQDTAQERAAGRLPPLAVVAYAPGAVLTEWAHFADAALILFLGGEQSSEAVARLVLGQASPSAKLPITLPLSEADTIAPCDADSDVCEYTEGVHTAWRGMQAKPVAYPFGHGLTYTRFEYRWASDLAVTLSSNASMARLAPTDAALSDVAVVVRIAVTNVGADAAHDVPQLYLAFPHTAQQPALVLRGYRKTPLLHARDSYACTFELTRRDLSTWSGGWVLQRGMFTAHLGASSRDLRLSRDFEIS